MLLVALTAVSAVVGDGLLLVHRMPAISVDVPGSGDGATYLLLASDSRERLDGPDSRLYRDSAQATGERADLVLVLRVPKRGRPRLLSIPRDLYVGADRQKAHRLGLALHDGPQAIVDSMCQDLGIGVDHVVIADFRALIDAVDRTGGVDVHTDAPMRDRQARLALPTAGRHRLDGRGALAWVRSRHPEVQLNGRWVPDPASDPTRTDHAAQVLSQLRQRLVSPASAQQAAWTVAPRLRRDEGLGLTEVLTLATALRTATVAGSVTTVPVRFTHTEVPFAFPTAASQQALAPLRTARCAP